MGLIFGLPGTGKTTEAKRWDNVLKLDLGSDVLTDKQLKKLREFTTGLLELQIDMVIDSYPMYFDPEATRGYTGPISFAIPLEGDVDLVLKNVGERDGFDSEFYKLYAKKIHSWIEDWLIVYENWKRIFPQTKLVSTYYKD